MEMAKNLCKVLGPKRLDKKTLNEMRIEALTDIIENSDDLSETELEEYKIQLDRAVFHRDYI